MHDEVDARNCKAQRKSDLLSFDLSETTDNAPVSFLASQTHPHVQATFNAETGRRAGLCLASCKAGKEAVLLQSVIHVHHTLPTANKPDHHPRICRGEGSLLRY